MVWLSILCIIVGLTGLMQGYLIGLSRSAQWRVQYAAITSKCLDLSASNWKLTKENDGLRAENDKLRELAKAFNWCTENFDLPCKCDSCPLPQSSALECECEVRMNELRIEVD